MRTDMLQLINQNQEMFDLMLDLIPVPAFVKNRQGVYINCNQAFLDLFDKNREGLIGRTAFELFNEKDAQNFYKQDEQLFLNGGLQIYESKFSSSDGFKHDVQFQKQVFYDATGDIAGFLGIIIDLTEKREKERFLLNLATRDELTSLTNRREGIRKLNEIHKVSTKCKKNYCIAMIDFDHFKDINDSYGHESGDMVLSGFSKFINPYLRKEDVCFRYGGEEFILIFPKTELNEGIQMTDNLRKAWSKKKIRLNNNIMLKSTFSVGIIHGPKLNATPEQLLSEVDMALYHAKNMGRNCVSTIQ